MDVTASNAQTRERLDDFFGQLSIASRKKVLGALRDSGADAGSPERVVVDAVISSLNHRRRHHAMRLWMGCLAPVLVHTPTLLHTHERLPHLLHRVDAIAWWQTLEPMIKAPAASAQAFVTARCRDAAIDDVIASEEAAVLAEELRRQSAAALSGINRNDGTRHRFLASVNAQRRSILRAQKLGWAPPLGPEDLSSLIAMLGAAPEWREALRDVDDAMPPAARLMRLVDVPGRPMLALAHAYATLDPRLAADKRGIPGGWVIRDGLVAVFAHLGHRLVERLAEIVPTRGSLRLHSTEAPPLSQEIERWFLWHDLAVAAGGRERDTAERLSEGMEQLVQQVNNLLLPYLDRMVGSGEPRQDWSTLLPKVADVGALRNGLKRRAHGAELEGWSKSACDHVYRMFRRECALGGGADFAVLATLARLAVCMDMPMPVAATSGNLVAAARRRLDEPTPLSALEAPLMERLITVCNEARFRNGRWTPPEVTDLLEAATGHPLLARRAPAHPATGWPQ
ncbi:hypothetical protein HL658_09765 [Azospirillum sp. RWY-5-1]|uniref:DUF4129 domain-containing protein n=1 Tax=Azospirillum oleiclasticum TaxID=2735135 RepID=A0ABX2TA23_9PROT|nr:hypothetical protein [Azospirillum oleiclasticum]NYZ12838.1 hypothetical protein [Azospirillum oleiclasticum]NYZ19998.1 hypothetical protein [Azospirillum oleiclasticum]